MTPTIITFKKDSPYLQDVITLGTQNSGTLGFLPQNAFIEFAKKDQILIAVDQKKTFLGYLLYGINKKEILAYITHLCIKESARGQGVAKALFSHLKLLTQDSYRGIRVHCRRDYEVARQVWPQLGFVAKGEKAGRSKYGSILTIWWFDHNHPDLLTFSNNQPTSKQQVIIDANIFFDFQSPIDQTNQQSHFLQADWLQEIIELCLTQEIFNEINRQEDPQRRRVCRNFAHDYFTILSTSDDDFKHARQTLQPAFPENLNERDKSDLNQVARSIAAGVKFFITRDQMLRKRLSKTVSEQFGVHLMEPADFIINQDEWIREAEYQPAKLAGSRIQYQRFQAEQRDTVEQLFYDRQREKKAEFQKKLSQLLANPRTFHAECIKESETPLALLVYGRQQAHELEIPILRINKHPLSPTVARYVVFRSVITAAREHRSVTKVTDCCLSETLIDALQENGFLHINDVWIKLNLSSIFTIQELSTTLRNLTIQSKELELYLDKLLAILSTAEQEQSIQTLLRIEKSLWPAKIADVDIPAFLVPIKPIWAMHLFDTHIATQDLFGANPNLMFQLENVYYRVCVPRILSAPARILWYVSKGEGDYQDVMAIHASSYLEEVNIDKPKSLFSRFEQLGIYRWEEIYKVAEENIDNEIMAFRFSHTETFRRPISRSELKQIWKEHDNKNFHLQGPLTISLSRFFALYAQGMLPKEGRQD